jgi:hypothetical protein
MNNLTPLRPSAYTAIAKAKSLAGFDSPTSSRTRKCRQSLRRFFLRLETTPWRLALGLPREYRYPLTPVCQPNARRLPSFDSDRRRLIHQSKEPIMSGLSHVRCSTPAPSRPAGSA